LAGYEIPETMQGRSLTAGMEKRHPSDEDSEGEKIIHDRLAGLVRIRVKKQFLPVSKQNTNSLGAEPWGV